MVQPRGRAHSSLTETAAVVVRELKLYREIKMIAPGMIDGRRYGKRHITVVYTTPGCILIISGQGVQKVAVHLKDPTVTQILIARLKTHKNLKGFLWNERERKT